MADQQRFDIFDHYKVEKVLASKEISATYLASSLKHVEQRVVVKVFNQAYLQLAKSQQQTDDYFKTLISLHHQWLVPLLDLVWNEKQCYFVFAYLPHGSLRDRLQQLASKPMPWEEALITTLRIGQALVYAHAQGVTHANIKPENILYNEKDEALLGDFSLAPAIHFKEGSAHSSPSDLLAARYRAPEQFTGKAHHLSDQYALACLAYELFSGHPPFEAEILTTIWEKQANEVPTSLADLMPRIPESVARAITRALAKNPYDRYANMIDFLLELEYGSDMLSRQPAMKEEPENATYAMEINSSLVKSVKTPPTQSELGQEHLFSSMLPLQAEHERESLFAGLDDASFSSTTAPLLNATSALPVVTRKLQGKQTSPLMTPDDNMMTMFTIGESTPPAVPTDFAANGVSDLTLDEQSPVGAYSAAPRKRKRFPQPVFWMVLIVVLSTLLISAFPLFFMKPRTDLEAKTNSNYSRTTGPTHSSAPTSIATHQPTQTQKKTQATSSPQAKATQQTSVTQVAATPASNPSLQTPATPTGQSNPSTTRDPTTQPTPTPTVIPQSAYVFIKNQRSLEALDDTNGGTTSGTLVEQWTNFPQNTNQRWKLVSTGNGYYMIVSIPSGLAIVDVGGSGSQVQLAVTNNLDTTQQWHFVAVGDGDYYIINKVTGLYLDDPNGSMTDGTIMQLRTYSAGNLEQEWSLING
jgi:serine/threonine protein kinase